MKFNTLNNIFFEKDLSKITESSMTAKERNALDKSQFGLPELRKYPIHNKEHVKLAIKFFRYADKDEKDELAKNINKKIKMFKMEDEIHVGDTNPFKEYYKK